MKNIRINLFSVLLTLYYLHTNKHTLYSNCTNLLICLIFSLSFLLTWVLVTILHPLTLTKTSSPVTHRLAPWTQRIFIEFLPRILCIKRPKKEEEPQEELPPEVLTDVNVFHVPPNVEKYSPFCTNKFSTDFDIPGELSFMSG